MSGDVAPVSREIHSFFYLAKGYGQLASAVLRNDVRMSRLLIAKAHLQY